LGAAPRLRPLGVSPLAIFVNFLGGLNSWSFLRHEKKWWMIPIVLSLALIAVAASVGGSVAPWIYAIW